MSAPTLPSSTQPAPDQHTEVQQAPPGPAGAPVLPSTDAKVNPVYAGVAGAALGLGVGLVVAEFLVPGIVLGVLAIGGIAARRKLSRMLGRS